MKKIKALISDSDGTLVNTLYLIRHGQYESAVEYMQSLGIPRHEIPNYDIYEGYINKSVGGRTRETFEATIKLLFSRTQEQYLNQIDFNELDSRLQPIQDRIAPLYVHPYFGLTELFTWLGKQNINLAIFTSGTAYHIVRNYGISLPMLGYTDLYKNDSVDDYEKLAAFIKRIKAVYGISQVEVTTADDVTNTKPDPEGLLKSLDKLNLTEDEVLVIGDHVVDITAANAAGMKSVGISHGFSSHAELTQAGALRVVDTLNDITKLIDKHNHGEVLF